MRFSWREKRGLCLSLNRKVYARVNLKELKETKELNEFPILHQKLDANDVVVVVVIVHKI